MLVLPLVWFLRVDRGQFRLSLPTSRDWLAGILLGLLMFGILLAAYWLVGRKAIDPAIVREKAGQIGLTQPIAYLASAFYFTFINALVEEYIWRWFVYQKCAVLLSGVAAVCLAALCFTLHHIIALVTYTGNGAIAALASLGVFIAGAIWSWMYLAYRSLWACYLSHLLADLAIALIGWQLLFELS